MIINSIFCFYVVMGFFVVVCLVLSWQEQRDFRDELLVLWLKCNELFLIPTSVSQMINQLL